MWPVRGKIIRQEEGSVFLFSLPHFSTFVSSRLCVSLRKYIMTAGKEKRERRNREVRMWTTGSTGAAVSHVAGGGRAAGGRRPAGGRLRGAVGHG